MCKTAFKSREISEPLGRMSVDEETVNMELTKTEK